MTVRVLIVDDDAVIRQMLEMALSFEGFEVATAEDGIEAVAKARDLRPDVVLLDVMMPLMDGLQVASTLRRDRRTRDIPIVMLTACAGEEDVWSGWEAGAASYLTKPLEHEMLLSELDRVLPDRVGA